ncbi:MAG: hypothetical protein Q7S58_20345 [Candidatus Binatus sp.]|uniref:hypothetical protein n=1 Tax=Candidatus Binatus sp. TaxID=2811406 RepID=UPI0027181D24|nr:hypothetical protein [Candidatus Binatus sp.]MDO8434754.1 hypothetical protein [Candidatus Binatus sp.]
MAFTLSSSRIPAFERLLTSNIGRIAAIAIDLIGSSASAQASDATEAMPNRFELRPGVMIDAAAGAAYLMNPGGGIDAIDLSSGKLLWSTTAAAKPIALFDDRLAAQAETHGDARVLPIVVLDTKNGGKVVLTASIPMPDGTWASVDEGLGTSFQISARVEHERLLVSWSASQRTISGIASPGPPPERKDRGDASIDLKTGHVETLTAEQGARMRAGERPAKNPRMSGAERLQSPPRLVGNFFIATEVSSSGDRATLKRWSADTGEPLPDVELGAGFVTATPAADGLLVAAAKAVGAGPIGLQEYLWSIYSLTSGKRVAEIQMFPSSAPFFIWRSNLIYVSPQYARRVKGTLLQEPLELRALNLKPGTEVWKRELRDTAYRGPSPPSP